MNARPKTPILRKYLTLIYNVLIHQFVCTECCSQSTACAQLRQYLGYSRFTLNLQLVLVLLGGLGAAFLLLQDLGLDGDLNLPALFPDARPGVVDGPGDDSPVLGLGSVLAKVQEGI